MSVPEFHILSKNVIGNIIDEAMEVLEKVGVYVENEEALALLGDNGVRVDKKNQRIYCPRGKMEEFISKVPKSIAFYDQKGDPAFVLEKDNVVYDPGSAALYILDHESKMIRTPVSQDGRVYHNLIQNLKNIHAQSTAIIYGDVPGEIADSYRLYLALLYCSKPVITGTFRKESLSLMKDLLIAVRGSEKNLREKPLAIFDACPSPPLKWSDLTTQSLIDCARAGIPSEFVSMPLAGATAPITLKDAVVQHTVENFCGILITQSASSGAPIIYGGSPAVLDMRHGTTPMGAIETMLIDSAYSQVGKYFNLPIHAYMGLSDSKQNDYQAGLESGIGVILSALSGINMISGVGMLNFESCQSFEKLVMDNELCGMAYRLREGITFRNEIPAVELMDKLVSTGDALTDPHTLKWFRKELYLPGDVIDRSAMQNHEIKPGMSASDRAAKFVSKIKNNSDDGFTSGYKQELHKIMSSEANNWKFDIDDI